MRRALRSFASKKKEIIVSGIQPSPTMHLGHLLGSIRTMTSLQEDISSRCFFFIADLHSLGSKQTKDEVADSSSLQATMDSFALALACGIDPSKTCLFLQSTNPFLMELYWILSSICPIHKLESMPRLKSKSQGKPNLGLFSYSLLMAADILLYRANRVPIGEDQAPHITLARYLAEHVNIICPKTFMMPEALFSSTPKVASLQNVFKKMSSSGQADSERINLLDSPEIITKKIKSAKTDMNFEVTDDPRRRELANLIGIYSSLSGISSEEGYKSYEGKHLRIFKTDLAEKIIAELSPIQKEFEKLKKNKDHLCRLIEDGKMRALEESYHTKENVKKIFMNLDKK